MENDKHTARTLRRPPLFSFGRVVATVGALALLENTATSPTALLARHVQGDWGEVDPEDAQTNRDALVHGWRLMSVYRLPIPPSQAKPEGTSRRARRRGDTDTRIWVITEADRSVTTLLLPQEY